MERGVEPGALQQRITTLNYLATKSKLIKECRSLFNEVSNQIKLNIVWSMVNAAFLELRLQMSLLGRVPQSKLHKEKYFQKIFRNRVKGDTCWQAAIYPNSCGPFTTPRKQKTF